MKCKTTRKSAITVQLFAAGVLALVISACTGPFALDSDQHFGGLRVSGVESGAMGAQTVFPSVDFDDIAEYEIVLSDGPSGAADQEAIVEETNGGEIGAEFTDLVPGEWTIHVNAYDGDSDNGGDRIASGSTWVDVERGTFTEISVAISPVDDSDGDGTWELDITWPAQDDGDYKTTDVVTGYEFSIVALGDTPDPEFDDVTESFNGSADDDLYTLSLHEELDSEDTELQAGAYFFSVELTSESASPYGTVARYDEIWYIAENRVSRRTVDTDTEVALEEEDFSFGGGTSIDIAIDNEEDFEQFFKGLDESEVEVESGEQFDVEVEIEDDGASVTPDEVVWRINTQPLDESNDDYDAEEDTLDIFDDAYDKLVGQLTNVDTEFGEDDDGLAFTPAYGVDENGDIDDGTEFPAGVAILVTLQVEYEGLYYSDSFSVTVVESNDD